MGTNMMNFNKATHMIIVKNKKCSVANIKKEYPDAEIIDVTSKASDEFVRLSPFYPVGGIPVPGKEDVPWRGYRLKLFQK